MARAVFAVILIGVSPVCRTASSQETQYTDYDGDLGSDLWTMRAFVPSDPATTPFGGPIDSTAPAGFLPDSGLDRHPVPRGAVVIGGHAAEFQGRVRGVGNVRAVEQPLNG